MQWTNGLKRVIRNLSHTITTCTVACCIYIARWTGGEKERVSHWRAVQIGGEEEQVASGVASLLLVEADTCRQTDVSLGNVCVRGAEQKVQNHGSRMH